MTLNLTIKKQFFDQIKSGEKLEEYRIIKDYWTVRLQSKHLKQLVGYPRIFERFDSVKFTNGYAKDSPSITMECLGISIGTGKVEWGAEPDKEYYVIKLGKQLC